VKTGMTLQELSTELHRQNESKLDFLVNSGSLSMEVYDERPMLRLSDAHGIDLIEPLDIRGTAHRQLGDYLGIPRRYYERLLAEDTGLLAYNVNRWLREEPELRTIRTVDGYARAFLSNRYRCIDHLDIAEAVLPVIDELPGAQIASCNLTPDFMYIKVVWPKLTAEVTPGDVVQAGVMISNSETGLGSVCIHPLLYRLVCTNGMTVNASQDAGIRRCHKGRANVTSGLVEVLQPEALTNIDDDFVQKMQETVSGALDQAKFLHHIGQMRQSKELHLNTDHLESVVKQAGASFKITEAESAGVLEHLMADGDYTLFGLANAVTRYSQDVDSYDRASQLEGIGYSVMTMSPLLFRQINQAPAMAA